jgi:hypothetical protein
MIKAMFSPVNNAWTIVMGPSRSLNGTDVTDYRDLSHVDIDGVRFFPTRYELHSALDSKGLEMDPRSYEIRTRSESDSA